MKIAICISGFIRTWEFTKNSFKYLLCKDKTHEIDIFVNTYNQNYFEHSAGLEDVFYTSEEIHKMFEGFNVKNIVIENRNDIHADIVKENAKFMSCVNNQNEIKESSDVNAKSYNTGVRILDQIRKVERCFDLKREYEKKNNFKYDLAVKTRFDILYKTSPVWEYIKEGTLYTETDTTGGYPHDCVTFGKNSDMDKYSLRYSSINELIFTHNSDICAHDTFATIARINNLKIERNFIFAVILRSINRFHKIWEGTVDINELNDINLKKTLIKSLFADKVIFNNENLVLNSSIETNIILVSSMINITNKQMTIFSAEERLSQTLNTLKTIRDKIPNPIIILLEGSNINTEFIHTLYKHVDHLILYSYDEKIDSYVNNMNKSFGEVYKLLSVVNKLQTYDFNKIFKISGRYYLNENFNINNFTDEFISGKIINSAFFTSLYSVPKKEFVEYKNLLELFLKNNIPWVDIEHHIHNFYKNIKNVKNIDVIGLEGYYTYGVEGKW
jgi:hypothetical protein